MTPALAATDDLVGLRTQCLQGRRRQGHGEPRPATVGVAMGRRAGRGGQPLEEERAEGPSAGLSAGLASPPLPANFSVNMAYCAPEIFKTISDRLGLSVTDHLMAWGEHAYATKGDRTPTTGQVLG